MIATVSRLLSRRAAPAPLAADGVPGPSEHTALQIFRWLYAPLPLLDDCQARFGDRFALQLPTGSRTIFTSNPDDIREIFALDGTAAHAGESQRFLAPLVGPESVLVIDGDRHMRQRKLLMPPLHGERMHNYGTTMSEVALAHIARWPRGRAFPLHEETQSITLDIILRTVFGLERGARAARLGECLRDFTGTAAASPLMLLLTRYDGSVRYEALQRRFPRISPWGRLHGKRQQIDRLLDEEMAERRAAHARGEAPGHDVLALLLEARDEAGAPMSAAELRDELLTLLIAGHETTATALTYAIHDLASDPASTARARAEVLAVAGRSGPIAPEVQKLEFLDAVVKETLRLHPILPVVSRKLLRPLTLGGHLLETGTNVLPCIYLAQRRADRFPEPERFVPTRFLDRKVAPFEWFPFGGGIRRCLGMAFALYEMKIVLAEILRSVDLVLAPGYKPRVVRRGITFALSEGLPVVVHGRD